MDTKNKIFMIALSSFLIQFLLCASSHATKYFYFDAESEMVGVELPLAAGNPANFCQTECGGSGAKGTTQSSGGAPQGNQYFVWQTSNSQNDCFTQVKSDITFPFSLTLGTTYYLAYYMSFDRIGGNDIWHECTTCQSADKGVELDGSGIRWILSRGQWDGFSANQDHHYSVWGGNPSYHLNPVSFFPNLQGYSTTNMPQLEYERWYSIVMGVKMACDNSGVYEVWLNGIKIIGYNNIQTAANCSPDLQLIIMGGTIAQPYYDAPAHYRKFDALMLTDDWQDIINGGYLVPSTVGAPLAPTGLKIISQQ